MFTLVIKWAQNRKTEDVIVVGCLNYISAALLIFPFWMLQESTLATEQEKFWAAVTGGSMGLIYFSAYFLAIIMIRWVGASATSVISVLSMLLPIGFGAIYWDDIPSDVQKAGIGFAILALLLMAIKPKTSDEVARQLKTASPWLVPTIMIGFFLLCGCSRIAQDAFDNVSNQSEKLTFVLSAFVVSGIPSTILVIILGYRNGGIKRSEIGFGLLLGLSNMLQVHFVLFCLQYFPGFVVFPVTSAGSILFTMFVATVWLGEKLNLRSYISIAITVVALFMLQ